ncbi:MULTISPECIES: ATP-binding protein [unclassified Streptomyces]|uniref:ATP-binding protein n=1 Tax=unclassified Streptomyces TaxID=2593676 RepID=UPI002DDB5566|nr:ATP-binding protein [Streptomyces sp. NBC_01750]WSA99678.1 ATP-binding protein [Streptomyces sp. NBC_01794]WSD35873.1 ATP-binding protein [Streptomyces sp. NBC_01750]
MITADPLLQRLALLRDAVALLVERRGATDPTAADPLRGLYLSDESARRLLSAAPHPPDVPDFPDHSPAGDDGDRLRRLAGRLRLTALDARILLVALAPELDRTFEPLYGYLNDEISRRRATTGLALDLCGVPVHSAPARARFHPSAPLSALGLLAVEEPERPFLSRSLRVPDRIVAHLLGDDTPDAALDGTVRRLPDSGSGTGAARGSDPLIPKLAERLAAGPLSAYLREHRDGDALACVTAALGESGTEALHLTPGEHPPYPELLREARLTGRALVVTSLPEKPEALVRALAVDDVTVLLAGSRPYDPQWCDGVHTPLVLDAPRQRSGDLDAWTSALGASSGEPGFDLAPVVAAYRLGGTGIGRAARAALDLAAFDGAALSAAHLRLAARQQSTSGLERHARRIRPDVGWRDLVLPDQPLAQLHELVLRCRHRDQVLGDWRLSAGGGRGRGVLALFAGDSGTGKTLSAEVVAAELGLDLYVVQLPSIVDKYVGETEKNLERIFTEADRTDAVLLFDEADAVFGKRSEVNSSNDRHANLESAYLLQRLESFDGIALLTTNLRANIDDAFTRRLDLVVDFPFPDAAQRLALWRHSLAHVPCVDGIDPEPCARDFELAGGSIRSAVVTAAYGAAARGGPVSTADLVAGAQREYRKAGRLVMEDRGW